MQGCYERNTLKTSTFIRICDAQKLRYVVEEKKTNICIYFVFFEIFYIHFVFVHCAEWGSFAWFPCGVIRPRVCGDGTFPGNFLAGELGEIFVFFAMAVIIFRIC